MNRSFALGQLWRSRGRWSLASKCFLAAAREAPDSLPAWIWCAHLLEQEGRREEAAEVCTEARMHHPGDVGLAHRLAALQRPGLEQRPEPPEAERLPGQPRLLLYTDCPTYGAGEISHSLALAWRDDGWSVHVAQPPVADEMLEERRRAGIAHRFLQPDDVYDRTREPLAFTGHAEAEAILREAAPDLVVFADGCPCSNLAAKEAAVRLGVPACAVVHAAQPGWAHDYAAVLGRLAAVYASLLDVVAVCGENLEVLRTFFGLRGGRVIHNGRPARFFVRSGARGATRQRLGLGEGEMLALTVAHLQPRKGYLWLLECARRLQGSGIHFAWAGRGPLEPELRQQALGLPVHFLGHCQDVRPWLDACDAFVLLSEWEGMPLGVLEAMARGKPVLASAVSGIPEALARSGKLVADPRQDPEATIRETVEHLREWQSRPDLRLAVGRAARRRARKRFREERMIASYLAWTRNLMTLLRNGGTWPGPFAPKTSSTRPWTEKSSSLT